MTVRKLHHMIVGRGLRGRLWRLCHERVPELFHDLRWRCSSPAAREAWTARRLRLDESRWLFILGGNNSGTTLLSRILQSHPQVRSLPHEGQHLTRAVPRPAELGCSGLWTRNMEAFRWTEADDPAPAARARFDWVRHYEPRPGLLLEKSPPNTLRSRWLQANFRPSAFISLVRDPYAVCEGNRRRRGHTMEEACRHWVLSNECLLEDAPHLEHCLQLTYEALCERTLETVRTLEEFLGLGPFGDDLLSRTFDVHNAEKLPQAIRNMNPKSHARLSRDDIEIVTGRAGELMQRLGYDPL